MLREIELIKEGAGSNVIYYGHSINRFYISIKTKQIRDPGSDGYKLVDDLKELI